MGIPHDACVPVGLYKSASVPVFDVKITAEVAVLSSDKGLVVTFALTVVDIFPLLESQINSANSKILSTKWLFTEGCKKRQVVRPIFISH